MHPSLRVVRDIFAVGVLFVALNTGLNIALAADGGKATADKSADAMCNPVITQCKRCGTIPYGSTCIKGASNKLNMNGCPCQSKDGKTGGVCVAANNCKGTWRKDEKGKEVPIDGKGTPPPASTAPPSGTTPPGDQVPPTTSADPRQPNLNPDGTPAAANNSGKQTDAAAELNNLAYPDNPNAPSRQEQLEKIDAEIARLKQDISQYSAQNTDAQKTADLADLYARRDALLNPPLTNGPVQPSTFDESGFTQITPQKEQTFSGWLYDNTNGWLGVSDNPTQRAIDRLTSEGFTPAQQERYFEQLAASERGEAVHPIIPQSTFIGHANAAPGLETAWMTQPTPSNSSFVDRPITSGEVQTQLPPAQTSQQTAPTAPPASPAASAPPTGYTPAPSPVQSGPTGAQQSGPFGPPAGSAPAAQAPATNPTQTGPAPTPTPTSPTGQSQFPTNPTTPTRPTAPYPTSPSPTPTGPTPPGTSPIPNNPTQQFPTRPVPNIPPTPTPYTPARPTTPNVPTRIYNNVRTFTNTVLSLLSFSPPTNNNTVVVTPTPAPAPPVTPTASTYVQACPPGKPCANIPIIPLPGQPQTLTPTAPPTTQQTGAYVCFDTNSSLRVITGSNASNCVKVGDTPSPLPQPNISDLTEQLRSFLTPAGASL